MRWTPEPGAPVARLRGDVDADAAAELRAIGTVADEVQVVVVDLADVDFIDLSGLDLIEELAARPNVRIRRPSGSVLRVLERTSSVLAGWVALRSQIDL